MNPSVKMGSISQSCTDIQWKYRKLEVKWVQTVVKHVNNMLFASLTSLEGKEVPQLFRKVISCVSC